ncbi:DUF1837 domain-containing protein [Listeria monocytogenes]|uniref:DUF1837 domain-containing protein n=1 Tax=Listeria monocytogenes TaxID=1639 RepID=A0A7U7YJ09_LISMN|nr:DUF1837 domain-containing protein [Listeria monocytogenes]MDA20713.1 DUF1837 domain-containing protein [Listeria monocytogenes serotype 4a]EAC4592873.1 DUF1837 domain-containing protein [Listeria monocytogenes]EAC4810389.1 DUF1837 domain-containing protein [Listeria monocytogenes]EAC7282170.1 DUF1837 domain-containing protein [Listeria monocytogenes]EAC7286239.1 DUF1837 domain-containing protein [Listeria monocytogenes]
MEVSGNSGNILDVFVHVDTYDIGVANKLEIFLCPINANCFDYRRMIDGLLESVTDFALSRKLKESYGSKQRHLEKAIREKFIEHRKNKGELGEFLLYCFLEGHLNAPKILSKLELKTSNKMYVNGSDGVHFLKLENNNYQLIFGEAKTIKSLRDALNDAYESIYQFKNEINSSGDSKSGISFEKGLITDNLEKETWTDTEKEFLTTIIYPSARSDFQVDDAFGLFIGFEINIDEEKRTLNNQDFRIFVENTVKTKIERQIAHIEELINKYKLMGHSFYIYVLPFTELDSARQDIMEGLI